MAFERGGLSRTLCPFYFSVCSYTAAASSPCDFLALSVLVMAGFFRTTCTSDNTALTCTADCGRESILSFFCDGTMFLEEGVVAAGCSSVRETTCRRVAWVDDSSRIRILAGAVCTYVLRTYVRMTRTYQVSSY